MALQKDITVVMQYMVNITENVNDLIALVGEENIYLNKEITIPDGYIKITSLAGGKERIDFTVGIYRNSDIETLLYTKHYHFVPSVLDDSDNFIKQAYEYLKTLPEYSQALDC